MLERKRLVLILPNLKQEGPEWEAWRNSGVGASDLGVILGVAPKNYGTIKDLIHEKATGESKNKINSFIANKGKEIEAKVRAKFELTSDGEFPARCAEKGIVHASYDGLGIFPLEIKYCGAKNTNAIPAHHYVQMQQQMWVADMPRMLFIRSNDGVTTFECWVEFNPWFWKQAEKEIKKFWKRVISAKGISAKSL